MEIKVISSLIKDGIIPTPCYATAGSAGLDLRLCSNKPVIMSPGAEYLAHTGIAINLQDSSLAGLILPRSGLATKHKIILGNSVGLIDSDYQGELLVQLLHRGTATDKPFTLNPGERIAQLVIVQLWSKWEQSRLNSKYVKEFSNTSARGAGGFGHTGRS